MEVLRIVVVAGVVAALGSPLGAQAKLYKWVDADGNVSYSELKPPDVEANELDVKYRSVTAEEARQQLDSQRTPLQERREAREEEESHTTALKAREERLAENCKIARENLRVLQTNARIKGKDEAGQDRYISASEIPQRLEQAKANIDKYCE